MNELKEIALLLDGLSINRTGYKITEAVKTYEGWQIVGRSYRKEGDNYTAEERVSLYGLVNRMVDIYDGQAKWDILQVKVFPLENGVVEFNLTLRKVKNEKEDGSDTEEHMEAEELS